MKKFLIFALCSSFLVSSCDTYTGSGAYMGGSIGSILGSAIGGLSGGPRGSDMGTIIGMAGGAAVGAVIGSQADQRQQQQVEQYQRDKARRAERRAARSQQQNSIGQSGYDQSGYGQQGYDQPVYGTPNSEDNSDVFDSTNSGDDRFVDSNEDNTLNRNETCKVIFEIMNRGNSPVYDVVPTVVETTGNKHIYISPSIHVEKIIPGRGIRYTAMVKADNRLKNGMAHFCVSVIHEGKSISKVNEFNIPTRR